MWISLLFVLLATTLAVGEGDLPQVETSLGKAVGSWMTSRSGRKFAAFRTLPYAKPPVGELRFQAPQPVEKWDGMYETNKPLPWCAQSRDGRGFGVEDCLYLSVFTHNISGKAPVLFHIHGGAFAYGYTGNKLPDYLMDEDIVIVSTHYRVGIMGFLSFEDENVPGNNGMKDQVMALKWVQQNIASFGGDPKRVTIIGGSAGGTSVYHHTISPLSKGLFHQAVAESGTSYGIEAVVPPGFPKSLAEKLMKLLNCPTDSKNGIACAQNKTTAEILLQFPSFLLWKPDPAHIFGPVFEKAGNEAFLIGPISKWKHHRVPLLMGFNSAEGLGRTAKYVTDKSYFTGINDDFYKIAPVTFSYFSTSTTPDEVTKQIRQFYFKNKDISMKDWVNLTLCYGDVKWGLPCIIGANNHPGGVYFYYFDHIVQGMLPELNDSLVFGASHSAEFRLIWPYPHTREITNSDDLKMSKNLVKIIGNFVSNGSPISQDGPVTKWEKWTKESNNYIHITKDAFLPKKGLIEDRYNFWESLNYRDKYEKAFQNYASITRISSVLLSAAVLMSIFKLF